LVNGQGREFCKKFLAGDGAVDIQNKRFPITAAGFPAGAGVGRRLHTLPPRQMKWSALAVSAAPSYRALGASALNFAPESN